LLAFYPEGVTEPTPRRRMSLDDLRNDLAQVAPAKTEEDLDLFASELRLLLSGSESERQKSGSVLDKKALWERVTAEIDRHEKGPHEEDPHEPSGPGTNLAESGPRTSHEEESESETLDELSLAPIRPGSSLTDTPKSQD
jgi:hypothetical protein